jgi:hypothetical protein
MRHHETPRGVYSLEQLWAPSLVDRQTLLPYSRTQSGFQGRRPTRVWLWPRELYSSIQGRRVVHEASWLHRFGDSLGIMVVFKYSGETGSAWGTMTTDLWGLLWVNSCIQVHKRRIKPPQALSFRYPWDSVSRSHQTLCHPLHPQCTNYLFWLKTPLSSLSIISGSRGHNDSVWGKRGR